MERKEEILKIFPRELRQILGKVPAKFSQLQEIRLRAGKPALLVCGGREYAIGIGGELLKTEEMEPLEFEGKGKRALCIIHLSSFHKL